MPTFNVGNHVMLTLLSRNFRVLKFSSGKFKLMSKNTWKIQAQSILYGPVSYKFSRTAYHTRSEEGYIFLCDTELMRSQASRYLLWINAASHLAFKMFITCSHWKNYVLYSASHSRVALKNVGLQKEQKYSTFACHTCNEVWLCVLGIRKKEVGNMKR
jgi:hypothetical protein